MIENTKESEKELKTYYGNMSIYVASYIGGPFAAAYMLTSNESTAGESAHAKKVKWVGILGSLLIVFTIPMIPSELIDKIPDILIPLIYSTIAWQYSVHRERTRSGEGFRKHKWYIVLLIAVISLVLTFIPMMVLILFF